MQQSRPEPGGKTTSAGPLGAGLTMIAAVVAFTLAGRWLDEKLGWSSPLFLLVGFGLGAFGGFLHLVNSVAPELLPFRPKSAPTSKPGDEPESSDPNGDDADPV